MEVVKVSHKMVDARNCIEEGSVLLCITCTYKVYGMELQSRMYENVYWHYIFRQKRHLVSVEC
jgi:hypothetical protein